VCSFVPYFPTGVIWSSNFMNHLKFIKMIILFFKIIYSFLKNNDGLQVKKRKAKKKTDLTWHFSFLPFCTSR
jgi:hypothetical protein